MSTIGILKSILSGGFQSPAVRSQATVQAARPVKPGAGRTQPPQLAVIDQPLSSGSTSMADAIQLAPVPYVDPQTLIKAEGTNCVSCAAVLDSEGYCARCRQHTPLPPLKPGDLIDGRYLVKGLIAEGAYGWVFLAQARQGNRWVAMKTLKNPADRDHLVSQQQERQVLSRVRHSNLVEIHDVVTVAGREFLVMEYIGGITLDKILEQQGRLPVEHAVFYLQQILDALGCLHQNGLVYNDLKPSNIMVAGTTVRIIDLGAVCPVNYAGDVFATPGYHAPEQARLPSVQSDLFTAGRVLAEMLTDFDPAASLFVLPAPQSEPLFARIENGELYRWLLKATDLISANRFASAAEAKSQLQRAMSVRAAAIATNPAVQLSLRQDAVYRVLSNVSKVRDRCIDARDSERSGNVQQAIAQLKEALICLHRIDVKRLVELTCPSLWGFESPGHRLADAERIASSMATQTRKTHQVEHQVKLVCGICHLAMADLQDGSLTDYTLLSRAADLSQALVDEVNPSRVSGSVLHSALFPGLATPPPSPQPGSAKGNAPATGTATPQKNQPTGQQTRTGILKGVWDFLNRPISSFVPRLKHP